jgi:hypothetical protein
MQMIIGWIVVVMAWGGGQAVAAPFVGMHGNEALVTFADQGTVRREGDVKTVWTYTVPIVDLSDGAGFMASKTEVDCLRQRHRDVYTASYSWDGQSITKDEQTREWETVVPGSFAVRLVDLVCRGKAPKVLSRKGTFLDVAKAARMALESRE